MGRRKQGKISGVKGYAKGVAHVGSVEGLNEPAAASALPPEFSPLCDPTSAKSSPLPLFLQ